MLFPLRIKIESFLKPAKLFFVIFLISQEGAEYISRLMKLRLTLLGRNLIFLFQLNTNAPTSERVFAISKLLESIKVVVLQSQIRILSRVNTFVVNLSHSTLDDPEAKCAISTKAKAAFPNLLGMINKLRKNKFKSQIKINNLHHRSLKPN